MQRLFVWLQYLLPQHGLSRLLGRLAAARSPRWLVTAVIRRFVARYDVDLHEAQESRPEAYPSFNAFFTRALRPGLRPLCESGIACPADGAISRCGAIDGDRLLQAKGRSFSLEALLGGDREAAARFRDGSFATIYLSPRDYHRVHMPLGGRLCATRYVPGRLFSVNGVTAAAVEGLFARNERLVCHFESERGALGMVLVGAMIVAGIETVWSGRAAPGRRRIEHRDYRRDPAPVRLQRGEELGRFLLGSTVILLLPPGAARWQPGCTAGAPVRLGQQLAP